MAFSTPEKTRESISLGGKINVDIDNYQFSALKDGEVNMNSLPNI